MGWFSRRKTADKPHRGLRLGRSDGPNMDIDTSQVEAHLRGFIETHRGVEAYVEPATSVSPTTVVLIAWDGEWTRRAIGTAHQAFALARGLGVPVYDVNHTGYPNRMREWNTRKRRGDA